jgi:hypothetical protein
MTPETTIPGDRTPHVRQVPVIVPRIPLLLYRSSVWQTVKESDIREPQFRDNNAAFD